MHKDNALCKAWRLQVIPATLTVTFPALAGAIATVFLAGILLGILAGTVNNKRK